MKRPWMPLYVGDYLRDTAHLSVAEHGAYLLLIMHYWVHENLPDDDRQLSRIARMNMTEWRHARPVIEMFFENGWKNRRVELEILKARMISEAGRAGGVASGKARKIKADSERPFNDPPTTLERSTQRIANGLPTECEPPQSQPQSQSQREGRKKEKNPDLDSPSLRPSPSLRLEQAGPGAADGPGPDPDPGNGIGEGRNGIPYAFEAGVIRLSEVDLGKWRKAFPHLSLEAELMALAEWARNQPKWFFAVASALAKKERVAFERHAAAANGTSKDDGIWKTPKGGVII